VTGPAPAVAAIRVAVRRALADVPAGASVAAAVSGGADSLALAAALAFERPGSAALVVDHRLQPGSAAVAARAAEQCRSLLLEPYVLTAAVDTYGGPEASARKARYAVLDEAAERHGLGVVLLGHTLDDQAETVLLGLARGSGARALAGMPATRGRYRRPLLEVERATTRQACADAGLIPWHDPHNDDPAYARVRVRHEVLPVLEREIGPGVAQALARTAKQLREDADALDALASGPLSDELDCATLADQLPAVRARVVKRWAEQQADTAVTAAHVSAVRELVEHWHGQGPVGLPGGARVVRADGRLTCRRD